MDEHTDKYTDEHAEQFPSTPRSGDDDDAPAGTDGDAGLRTLALRLLRGASADALQDLQLLPGALPPGALPFTLPLPPGARVVGALTGRRQTRVVLDADDAPERVLANYREQLRAAGWTASENPMGGRTRTRGGFLHTVGPTPERHLRWFSQEEWVLSVEVAEGGSAGGTGSTDVQVTCYLDAPPRRSQQPRGPRRAQQAQQARQEQFDPGQLVPLLTPPAGGRQQMLGSGGDFDYWRSSARLATELDLAAIAAHYARQLAYAGWARRGGGESGSGVLAWSAWDFTDEDGEPWQGMLVALQEAPGPATVPGVYLLELRVTWAGGEPGDFPADGEPQHQQPRGPRRAQQAYQQQHYFPGRLVPRLAPPAGARQRGRGGGGSYDDWRSSFLLATKLDLAAIAVHYAQQLEQAGWTRRGGGERSGGVLAWSAWDFTDKDGEPWQGQLVLVALRWQEASGAAAVAPGAAAVGVPGVPGIYLLEVRLMWAGGEPDALLSR